MDKLTGFYDFVIRKESLASRGVSRSELIQIMESTPSSESDDLLVFGPSFGGEAAQVFLVRLKELGLEYVDDFYIIELDLPEWLQLFCGLADVK